MTVEPDESVKRAFRSIEGWIELEQYKEAATELHNLTPDLKSTTSFIKAWIRIYEAQSAWTNVEMLATTLNEKRPDDLFGISKLAEALFQQHDPGRAISKLAEWLQVDNGQNYPKVRYNFARYFCATGALKEAREHLKAAIRLDRSLKMKALSDKDLEQLWTELQRS